MRASSFRCAAPGMPPGSTTMSYSSCSATSSVVSGTSCTPRLALTTPGLRPALTTSMPARRKRSMTVTASSSSQPSARGTRTFAMTASSVPEVLELQRKIGDGLAHQRDRLLQQVALGARHTHAVALDAGLHLELAVLDALDDLLRQLGLDAGLHRHAAPDLVARHLLDAAYIEAFHVDAALGELLRQDVVHLVELELGVGVDRQHVVGLLEARGDFLVDLVDRVAHFLLVDLGHDVKTRHIADPFPLSPLPALSRSRERGTGCRYATSRLNDCTGSPDSS